MAETNINEVYNNCPPAVCPGVRMEDTDVSATRLPALLTLTEKNLLKD